MFLSSTLPVLYVLLRSFSKATQFSMISMIGSFKSRLSSKGESPPPQRVRKLWLYSRLLSSKKVLGEIICSMVDHSSIMLLMSMASSTSIGAVVTSSMLPIQNRPSFPGLGVMLTIRLHSCQSNPPFSFALRFG